MAARRVDRLQEVEMSIKAKGGMAIIVKTDVTKREDVCLSKFHILSIIQCNDNFIFERFNIKT